MYDSINYSLKVSLSAIFVFNTLGTGHLAFALLFYDSNMEIISIRYKTIFFI